MKRAFLTVLLTKKDFIKQRWRDILEQAPLHSPLGNPDLFAYMMDHTLDDLIRPTKGPKYAREDGDENVSTMLQKPCKTCGLNPYIGYFLAGEAALVSAIRTIEPGILLSENDILASEIKLLFAFRLLSHREVNHFCEICWIQNPAASSAVASTLPTICPFKADLNRDEEEFMAITEI